MAGAVIPVRFVRKEADMVEELISQDSAEATA